MVEVEGVAEAGEEEEDSNKGLMTSYLLIYELNIFVMAVSSSVPARLYMYIAMYQLFTVITGVSPW